MSTPTYKLGQVIFIVPKKETKIFPMQVVEISVKKTLDGETVTYMAKGGPGQSETIAVSDIDGEIFNSADTVQKVLLDRVQKQIARMVEAASKKAIEWYPGAATSQAEEADVISALKKPAAPNQKANGNSNEVVIDLGDGTVGKVRLPDVLKS